jgi:hypothetical protein
MTLDPPTTRAYYPDRGCAVAPWCLACPLPRCVLDHPGGARRARVAGRDAQIVQLVGQGWPVAAVARSHGISRRHAYRIVRREETPQ